MALIVGGQTVTTDEAGTNKLDATKLFGNLPSLDGGSLTNIGLASGNFVYGTATVNANENYYVTAPNPGVAIGYADHGGTKNWRMAVNGNQINLRNTLNGSNLTSYWVTIAG